jgi:hypothetical protein
MMFDQDYMQLSIMLAVPVSNAQCCATAGSKLQSFCWGHTCCCGARWVCHLQLAHHALQRLVGLGVQGPAVQQQQQQQ